MPGYKWKGAQPAYTRSCRLIFPLQSQRSESNALLYPILLLILVPSDFLKLTVEFLLRNTANHSLPADFAAEITFFSVLLASAKSCVRRQSCMCCPPPLPGRGGKKDIFERPRTCSANYCSLSTVNVVLRPSRTVFLMAGLYAVPDCKLCNFVGSSCFSD